MPDTRLVVLAVGPPTHLVGGMAVVAEQVLQLDSVGPTRMIRFDTTTGRDGGESVYGRIARHKRHLKLLRNEIRRANASIVHIHTCSGFSFYRSAADLFVARRAGSRTVLHIHGASFDEFVEKSHIVARRFIRNALQKADRVVALSSSWKEKIQRIAPRARITVIENAVDIPASSASPGDGGVCRMAMLAKMDVWKGVEDILRACALLKNFKTQPFALTMAGPAGSAGDAEKLACRIQQHEISDVVRYIGPVRGIEKDLLLQRSHLYVQPSHHEGMPLAVLEAMAYGLPVVATRVGAIPEVVENGTHGMLTPPHNPDDLAGILRHLIENRSLREKLGAAAHTAAVARFSLARYHGDLRMMYQKLMASRPSEGIARANVELHRTTTTA